METVALITEILNGGMNLILAIAVYFLWKKLDEREKACDDERRTAQIAFDTERKEIHAAHREDMERLGNKVDKVNEKAWAIAAAFSSTTDNPSTEDGS